MRAVWILNAILCCALPGCDFLVPDVGGLGERCFGDGTCNKNLSCNTDINKCQCQNHWVDQGNDCGSCPPNWDPSRDCNECLSGWYGENCVRSSWSVPPSGQDFCCDDLWFGIVCPGVAGDGSCGSISFCGQDAQYPDGPREFSVEGISPETLVADSLTGLVWKQPVDGISTGGMLWDDAVANCDGLTYAGYTDWRLPSAIELLTIVDWGQYNPVIDSNVFPFTPSGCFHTSDAIGSTAWIVDFSNSFVGTGEISSSCFVRCVRGGKLTNDVTGRFIVTGTASEEGLVIDQVTGLGWQKAYTTANAWMSGLSYCESLLYGGHDDWRLPNANELLSLVNFERADPASDFPEIETSQFCSSTSRISDPAGGACEFVMAVNYYGQMTVQPIFKPSPGFGVQIRCVREGL